MSAVCCLLVDPFRRLLALDVLSKRSRDHCFAGGWEFVCKLNSKKDQFDGSPSGKWRVEKSPESHSRSWQAIEFGPSETMRHYCRCCCCCASCVRLIQFVRLNRERGQEVVETSSTSFARFSNSQECKCLRAKLFKKRRNGREFGELSLSLKEQLMRH